LSTSTDFSWLRKEFKKWATWGPEVTLSDYGLCTLQQRQFDMTVLYQTGATTLEVFLDVEMSRDVNVEFFVLGDSPASEFYLPTFRNTVLHFHRWYEQEE
jgi:hypothetical protein